MTYPRQRWCVCGHRDTSHARHDPGRLIWCSAFDRGEKCPCKRFEERRRDA